MKQTKKHETNFNSLTMNTLDTLKIELTKDQARIIMQSIWDYKNETIKGTSKHREAVEVESIFETLLYSNEN